MQQLVNKSGNILSYLKNNKWMIAVISNEEYIKISYWIKKKAKCVNIRIYFSAISDQSNKKKTTISAKFLYIRCVL